MISDAKGAAPSPPDDDDEDDGADDTLIHQYAASEAGFFRTCRLPRCRRARRCTGCRWPGGADGDLPDMHTYPPCITTRDDLERLIEGLKAVCRRTDAALALPVADGEEDDDGDEPFVLPPPEGLPRQRRRGRHGGRRARRGRAKAQETPSASAEIQNTASCDSAVSSQTKSRCGNSSSRISRPEPISQIMPPSGLR